MNVIVRRFALFFRSLVVLLFAFAVLNCVPNAKRESLKSPSNHNTEAVKKEIQRHSTRALRVFEQQESRDDTAKQYIFTALDCAVTCPTFRSVAYEAKLRLLHPGRIDLRGIYSLHRPPPSLL
jgi:hypothetical protein